MIRLYIVSFVDALLVSVQSTLNPYITSSFGRHGLLAAVSIIPTILAGTAKLTLAKIIDLAGRIEGFMFMLFIIVLGCIIKATAQTIETYIAAHTLYWTGHLGLLYVIDVMLSDMTTLKNRMLILTINATPTIATTFAGPRVGELFYNQSNFRWAFGAFAFIMTGICLPVIVVMLWSQRKATKTGALVRYDSGRNWWQSIVHIYVQMDSTFPHSSHIGEANGNSHRYPLGHTGVRALPAAIQLGVVCTAGLANWVYHRHAGVGFPVLPCLLSLGAVPRT